jgi:hypothetical protein
VNISWQDFSQRANNSNEINFLCFQEVSQLLPPNILADANKISAKKGIYKYHKQLTEKKKVMGKYDQSHMHMCKPTKNGHRDIYAVSRLNK